MTIVAAALKIGDVVFHIPAPARHHHILHWLTKLFKGRTDRGYELETQGFITDDGVFLDRPTAYRHAIDSGQVLNRRAGGYDGTDLFSEDLW